MRGDGREETSQFLLWRSLTSTGNDLANMMPIAGTAPKQRPRPANSGVSESVAVDQVHGLTRNCTRKVQAGIKAERQVVDRRRYTAPLKMQPEVGVSITTILVNPGKTGCSRRQIHCASNSLVGFSRPAMSFR